MRHRLRILAPLGSGYCGCGWHTDGHELDPEEHDWIRMKQAKVSIQDLFTQHLDDVVRERDASPLGELLSGIGGTLYVEGESVGNVSNFVAVPVGSCGSEYGGHRCMRSRNHTGHHEAYGGVDESVVWMDEPECEERFPSSLGEGMKCTRQEGHEGVHSAHGTTWNTPHVDQCGDVFTDRGSVEHVCVLLKGHTVEHHDDVSTWI